MGSLFSGLGQALGSVVNPLAQGLTPQNQYNADTSALQGQQQGLASALLAQSQGQGPNPAQAMLNAQTNQNIQQNAGFIGSQKGISPALAQRLAAENEGMMSQQAAQAGATLGAQQQLAAQGQLANVYGQIGNEQLGTAGINSGVAQGNAAANQNTAGGLLNASGFAATSGSKAGAQQGLFSSGGGAAAAAKGGTVGKNLPPHLHLVASIYHPQMLDMGGTAKVMVSPDEEIVPPKDVKSVAKGKKSVHEAGVKVPGHAEVKGDSKKNDKVMANPEPGSIVIPRSVMQSKNPEAEAQEFIAKELSKRGHGTGKDDFKAALKDAIKSRKGK